MIEPVFRNRDDAGSRLADALADRVSGPVTVLAIPRGGVAVAAPVANALGAPLDVVIPRKLRAPDNPELAIGAVAPGIMVLHERAVRQLRVPRAYIQKEAARQEAEIVRREAAYRAGRAPAPVAGRTVVVIDDGVATGATAVAAHLEPEADDVLLLEEPFGFLAVGEWYRDFDQATDEEVVSMLRGAGR